MPQREQGFVYVLTNPSLLRRLKIGFTEFDVEDRAQALSRATGVPKPFDVSYQSDLLPNGFQVEQTLHREFRANRPNPRREFFVGITTEQVVERLELIISGRVGLVQRRISIAQANETRADAAGPGRRYGRHFRFGEHPVPVGATIRFRHFDAHAIAISARQVRFEGMMLSLSAATEILRGRARELGNGMPQVAKGNAYVHWLYEERRLSELYDEHEDR